MSLEQFVKAQLEVVACNVSVGVPESQLQAVSARSATSMCSHIQTCQRMDATMGAEILRYVTQSNLMQEDKKRVVESMNARLCAADEALPSGRSSLQTNDYIFNYLTPSDWAQLENEAQSVATKNVRVARRMIGIGLRHPGERSFALAAAIVQEVSSAIDCPSLALASLREFKTTFKSLLRQTPLPTMQEPAQTFPAKTSEFKAAYPDWHAAGYGDDEPIESSKQPSYWATLRARTPCRSTRAGRLQISYTRLIRQLLQRLPPNQSATITNRSRLFRCV